MAHSFDADVAYPEIRLAAQLYCCRSAEISQQAEERAAQGDELDQGQNRLNDVNLGCPS